MTQNAFLKAAPPDQRAMVKQEIGEPIDALHPKTEQRSIPWNDKQLTANELLREIENGTLWD